MNIRNRLQVAYNVITNKQLSNSLAAVTRNYTGSNEFNPNKQVYGITYKAIDKIGLSVSNYEPQPKKANGDAYENHPVKNLAMRPNKYMYGNDFHRLWGMLEQIYGESFWYLVKGEQTGKVKEIYLLPPAQMEIVLDDDGEVVGYVLHKNSGEKVPFDLTEVYHHKTPNPFNQLRGLSALERASVYVNTEITTSEFTLNYMKNNASPSGIVTLPTMSKETFKQFTQQWREGYEGPQNAGKTAFIRGSDVDFKAVGATLHDVDQKVTREMAKDDVLMMFDVPKGLLGIAGDKGLGRTEIEALEYVFAKYKIQPMMESLDEIWWQVAKIGKLNIDNVVKIDHISPIASDKNYELERKKAGVNIWLTVNEIREQEGLPPLDGGDVLMTNNTVPAVQTKSKKLVLKNTQKEVSVDQETFRSKLIDNSEEYAKKIKNTISKFASAQEEYVTGKINASDKAYEEWLFSVKDASEELAALLAPIVIELMQSQAQDVATFVNGNLLEITPEIKNFVDSNMKQIAGLYNEDTIKALQKSINEGATQGESLVKIKKRVESVFSDAKGYRAERIARTESARHANYGAELSYKQSGYSSVKWITNPNACEFCRTFEGQVRTIGGKYIGVGGVVTTESGNQMSIDYRDIEVPPLHPNCKCSLVPEK